MQLAFGTCSRGGSAFSGVTQYKLALDTPLTSDTCQVPLTKVFPSSIRLGRPSSLHSLSINLFQDFLC